MRSQYTRTCSVDGCSKLTSGRGLCAAHYYHLLKTTETRQCTVPGCERPRRSRGYCNTHYVQWQRTGDPTSQATPTPKQACTVAGCETPQLARGLCNKHYLRLKRQGTLDASVRSLSDDERFLAYSGSADQTEDSCWLWTGGLTPNGYGKFKVDGRTVGAHVYALERLGIEIPQGCVVRHRCPCGPNKRCVNPAHLRRGTQGDNMRDRDDDGNTVRGERQHAAKLTDATVGASRERRATGETLQSIADSYGVSKTTISVAVRRRTWKHVL